MCLLSSAYVGLYLQSPAVYIPVYVSQCICTPAYASYLAYACPTVSLLKWMHAQLTPPSPALVCLLAFFPGIIRQRGRLVVIASMAAKVPSPGQAVYSGAKAALWGYFLSLAAEVSGRCVCVCVCSPQCHRSLSLSLSLSYSLCLSCADAC
jgi:NAD(P)-dependent dehydrogenase (short-subunit alcohol dehydrogenase family)